jgi:hypothetical protein
MGIIDDIRRRAANSLSAWANGSNEDISADEMIKALQQRGLAEPTEEKPKAMFFDPYAINDWGGWRQRPSMLTYEALRHMSMTCAPLAAIIQLRTNQMAQFARPQQGKYDKGYRVILRDRRDRNRSMTPVERKRAMEIERMLETTGVLQTGERARDRDSFRTFMKKGLRDTLTYDQFAFEKLADREGRVSRFIALPSETIRPAVLDVEHADIAEMRSRVSYVQVYENTVIAEFAYDDLAWCIMNPRSDLRTNGFGFSPIEQIIRLVTAWLFGFQYNQAFFQQGSAVKGLLNIKGTIPDKQMRAFRRQWYSMISGVENAWRTPILNSEDIQWVSMHSNNREMEFSAWMDWVTKLICAVYGVDPLEINFQFGNTGQSSSLNTGDQESKLAESKDKGLRPLSDHFTDVINSHLIWDLAPDFEFMFGGMFGSGEEADREALSKDGSTYKTVNEIRAQEDMAALPGEQGKAILNSTWIQWALQKDAAAQQAQQGGDPSQEPGQPPGAGAAGPAQPDEEPDDNLLHQDGQTPPWAVQSDDEGDDQLISQQAKKSARDIARFATNELRKARVSRVVRGSEQTIEIRED